MMYGMHYLEGWDAGPQVADDGEAAAGEVVHRVRAAHGDAVGLADVEGGADEAAHARHARRELLVLVGVTEHLRALRDEGAIAAAAAGRGQRVARAEADVDCITACGNTRMEGMVNACRAH